MKFDLVTLYPMHRRCITLISSLLNPSGWVRKPLNYLKVRTGMYRYILLRTNMEFLYCPVPSRTGTYWYVPVRTILPNPVQGYRIPDVRWDYARGSDSAMLESTTHRWTGQLGPRHPPAPARTCSHSWHGTRAGARGATWANPGWNWWKAETTAGRARTGRALDVGDMGK